VEVIGWEASSEPSEIWVATKSSWEPDDDSSLSNRVTGAECDMGMGRSMRGSPGSEVRMGGLTARMTRLTLESVEAVAGGSPIALPSRLFVTDLELEVPRRLVDRDMDGRAGVS
jgi:hypothetical protein